MRHEDDAGNTGVLVPGSIQWLNTGRGIMHNEGPEQPGHINGFQLWINVPAEQRLTQPGYTDYTPLDVTEVQQDGVRVRVISGTALGATSQAKTSSKLIFLHYYAAPGSTVQQPVTAGDNAFVYVLRGEIRVSGQIVKVGQRAYTHRNDNTDGIEIVNNGSEEAEYVILGGTPSQTPTVTWGPFVGNTEQDILTAFREYKSGINGFEAAPEWRSRWNHLVNKGRRRYTEAPELNADGKLPPFDAKKYILPPIAA